MNQYFSKYNQLSPSVLARSVFCENALNSAINMGCSQYVIFASGYDTFSLRNNYETATNKLFTNYNKSNPSNIISAPKGINYCIAIKKC